VARRDEADGPSITRSHAERIYITSESDEIKG
jgi:hypothetical protein